MSQAGLEVETRDIGKEPLAADELRALLGGRPPSILFSWKSPTAKTLGVDPKALPDERLIALMAEHPNLIRRPTLAADRALHVGKDDVVAFARACSGDVRRG